MRILYLAHRLPDQPSKGDKIRSYHQLCALCARHEVHVVAADDEPGPRAAPPWADAAASHAVFPLGRWAARARTLGAVLGGSSLSAAHFAEPALRRHVAGLQARQDFDVTVVYSGAMVPAAGDASPLVVDLVDVDSAKFADYCRQGAVRGPTRWAFALEARRLRRLEQEIARRAALTLLCTEAEATTLRSFASPRRLEVVPNGVDLEAWSFHEGPRERAEILFVGALDYQANVDAARHLVQDLLPALRTQVPEACVTLVGRHPTAEVRALASGHVRVEADVPSVLPFVQRATLTLLPFRIARGIQNKALEALAAGLPVVMSGATARGLAGTPGRHFEVGEDAAQLVRTTAALLQDPGRRAELARQGRALVEERYSWKAALDRFLGLVEETARGGEGGS